LRRNGTRASALDAEEWAGRRQDPVRRCGGPSRRGRRAPARSSRGVTTPAARSDDALGCAPGATSIGAIAAASGECRHAPRGRLACQPW